MCDLLNTLTLNAENLIMIGSVVLRYGQPKSKVRGAFIEPGMFIRSNTVLMVGYLEWLPITHC